MSKQTQDHTEANHSPQRLERTAKQNWDNEGGSLHPDETKDRSNLADPVDMFGDEDKTDDPPAGDVRAIYANDRDPGDALPDKPGS